MANSVPAPVLEETRTQRALQCSALVENSRGFIAISDTQGAALTYLNPAGRRLIGLESDEPLGSISLRELLAAEEWQRITDEVLPVLLAKGAWQGEMHLRHVTSGEILAMAAANFQMLDAISGRPTGLAWVMTDMRAQQHQQAELRRAKEVAEAAAQAKSEFLATMSHEIRTPMNGVIGMAGLLLDTPLSEQQRSMIDTLRSSADSLLTILNDILDFSKIEAGRMELEVIDFDLRQVVEDAVALLAEHAHAKGLEVACSIAADVPVAVRGDPGRLRQVLVNLVSNAVKFTEKGEVVVRVALKSDASSGLHRAIRGILPASGVEPDLLPVTLEIEVEDTGIGIPFASQSRLFRPFSQADSSTTRRFGGTGLGLAICKRLVELMGGGISLASAPSLGSTFRFTVCLVPRTARPLPVSPLLAGLRVLVTDDNATYRSILAAHLRGWGMVSEVVDNAQSALEHLAQGVAEHRPYRIAIVDMRMPGQDGLHTAAAIRACTGFTDTAIILLTTLDSLALGSMSRDLDIAAVLSKPIRETQLHDVLVRVISGVDTAQPALKPSSAMGIAQLKGRVLVVEDNAVNQRLASVQLGKLGLLADVAGDGAEALAALAQRPYDAVLMDCQMPGMDGYQTTRELRRREALRGDDRRLPVIAMTANALEGDRERCLSVGMDDYVAKPVRIEALAQTLERWLPRASIVVPPMGDAHAVPSTAVGSQPSSFALVEVVDQTLLAQVRTEISDDAAFAQMLEMFVREIPERCAEILQAYQAQDLRLLRTRAHKLRGSCQILGAKRLAHLCGSLEQAAVVQDATVAQTLLTALPGVQAATLSALIAPSH